LLMSVNRSANSEGEKDGFMERRLPVSERCVLSYDLNNDLQVILKRCEMLKSLITDREMSKHLNLIRAAAEHMAERIAERPCRIGQTRHDVA